MKLKYFRSEPAVFESLDETEEEFAITTGSMPSSSSSSAVVASTQPPVAPTANDLLTLDPLDGWNSTPTEISKQHQVHNRFTPLLYAVSYMQSGLNKRKRLSLLRAPNFAVSCYH